MKRDNLALMALCTIAFVVTGFVFRELRPFLLPFAIAVLFSILFHPAVVYLKQRRVPVPVSLLGVFGLLGVTLLILGSFFYAAALPLIGDLPTYQDKLDRIVTNLDHTLNNIIRTFGFKAVNIDSNMLLEATTVTAEVLSSTLRTFVDFIGKASLVLLFMLFMLAGTGDLLSKVRSIYPADVATRIETALKNIGKRVRHYLVIRILLSGVTGLLTLLVLWMLGLDFPLFWGFLAFLLSFIPTVGSVLAIGLPFVFSLLQFDTIIRPTLLILLLGALYFVIFSVIQPKLMAATLNLSPLLVLVALIFWGLLWGAWGMILAIPLTTTIKIIFENIEPLRHISLLMSDKSKERES